ncbi:MAG: hypothetical protein ACI8P0_000779 [Planctomycetaceae bacterium]|jgi:hypothetical protein
MRQDASDSVCRAGIRLLADTSAWNNSDGNKVDSHT